MLAELLIQGIQVKDSTNSGALLAKWHMVGKIKHQHTAFKLVFFSFLLRIMGVWERPERTKNVTCGICMYMPGCYANSGVIKSGQGQGYKDPMLLSAMQGRHKHC